MLSRLRQFLHDKLRQAGRAKSKGVTNAFRLGISIVFRHPFIKSPVGKVTEARQPGVGIIIVLNSQWRAEPLGSPSTLERGTAGSREDILGGGNFTKGVERLEYICGQRNQTLKSLVVYTDPIKF